LTDPHRFSGIGNAYSDEILHRARLSPRAMSTKLETEEIQRLYDSIRSTLTEWLDRLRAEVGDDFPEAVKANRAGMAVHGRFNEPCPDCGTAVQRLRRARTARATTVLAVRPMAKSWPTVRRPSSSRAAVPAPSKTSLPRPQIGAAITWCSGAGRRLSDALQGCQSCWWRAWDVGFASTPKR